jgi:NAD(P)-dependent dehydrogenase (short-subunit alcohol dehydrogenase family)
MKDQLRFDGRSVVVTGAGRGIGRSHALALAGRGARVVVADFGGNVDGQGGESTGPADDVVAEIEAAGGEAVAAYASVADPAGAASIVETALDAFGRLDVVVNNAGISDPDRFEDLSLARFQKMVDVHYLGTVYVLKAAWPHLQAAGYGRIVNTCSEAMLGVSPKLTSYSGGKGGVFGLTRALACEGPKYGILVNGVAPRAGTRMSDAKTMSHVLDLPEDVFAGTMQAYPPAQVSPAVVYLAHEACRVNGEVFVSGGGVIQRLVFSATRGLEGDALTPEDVDRNLDELMDVGTAQVVEVGFGVGARG